MVIDKINDSQVAQWLGVLGDCAANAKLQFRPPSSAASFSNLWQLFSLQDIISLKEVEALVTSRPVHPRTPHDLTVKKPLIYRCLSEVLEMKVRVV